jgi:hypothetical protein
MPVVVADARADHRRARAQALQERGAGSTGAAVMGHLEQIPAAPIVADDREQVSIAVGLQVAGEEGALAAHAQREHDRGVVDGASRGGCHGGQRLERRPEHVHPRITKPEAVALGEADAADAEARGSLAERTGTGTLGGHAGLGDAPDTVARHQPGQSSGVVFVRMGEHHEGDAAIPDGDALVEAPHEQVGIGSAVHEDAAATRALHEDGIALADVEDGEAQARRRLRRRRDKTEAEQRCDGPECTEAPEPPTARRVPCRRVPWTGLEGWAGVACPGPRQHRQESHERGQGTH